MSLRDKTIAELHYIIKDAGEAMQAFKGSGLTVPGSYVLCENKYADQVNDACTELYRRQNAANKQKGINHDQIHV